MRFTPRLRAALAALLLVPAALAAAPTLSPLFRDGAVLQQGRPIPVWGTAEPGTPVTVTLAETTARAIANPAGRWLAELPPLAASAAGAELTVTAGEETVTVRDVLVGEVWIASGQSNMEWRVHQSEGAAEAIAQARLPLLREFRVPQTVAETPQEDCLGSWKVCAPETAPQFSAVAFYFAREVMARLPGVPVGIVHTSWGGTPVEAWMPAETLASDPAFAVVAERWQETLAKYPAAKAKYDAELAAWEQADPATRGRRPRPPNGPGHQRTPSGLYNGMVHPLTPYGARGFIWYQGEDNASRAGEYHALFAAMIRSWRAAFGQGELPFYWVQLANYKAGNANGTAWAFLREAQDRTLALPNTGQALAIDIGNPNDIHPRNKLDVGRRLARLALRRVYDQAVADEGPRLARAEFTGAAARVFFDHAAGLRSAGPVTGFELAGADRVFHPAEAVIEGETVRVTSAAVPAPVAVRYCFRHSPQASLYNAAGLPAAPFRTDDFAP